MLRQKKRKIAQNREYPKNDTISFYNLASPRIASCLLCVIRYYFLPYIVFVPPPAAGAMRTAHNNAINLFISMLLERQNAFRVLKLECAEFKWYADEQSTCARTIDPKPPFPHPTAQGNYLFCHFVDC